MLKSHFDKAKKSNEKPVLPRGTMLSEINDTQKEGLIDMSLIATNQLFNERLSAAQVSVFSTGNADLIDTFKDTARLLLSGANVPPSGGGFGNRESVGAGVLSMLNNGDTAPFDRFHEYQKGSAEYTPELRATVRSLQAELKAHCIEHGIKVHTTHNPTVNSAPKATLKPV